MLIRRKTFERLLADRERAQTAERRQLLTVIAQQADRIMFMAGHTWEMPAQPDTDTERELEDEPGYDPGDLPDDLGHDPY